MSLATSFVAPRKTYNVDRSLQTLNMVSSTSSNIVFPRDVKDAVSKCRAAVQKSLENKLSRITVEMPVGAKYGVEKQSSSGKKKNALAQMRGGEDDSVASSVTYEQLEASDRELARLFVEMFQPVGGENICVVFNDENSASKVSVSPTMLISIGLN